MDVPSPDVIPSDCHLSLLFTQLGPSNTGNYFTARSTPQPSGPFFDEPFNVIIVGIQAKRPSTTRGNRSS